MIWNIDLIRPFLFQERKKNNTVGPYFGSDFGLLGPDLDHKISQTFFGSFRFIRY